MNTLSHGSANQVVRSAGDVGDAVDEEAHALRFELGARRGDVVAEQRDVREAVVDVTDASAGRSRPGAFGYSITSITRSLSSATPMIAAFTTTGAGTSSPMSRVDRRRLPSGTAARAR